MTYFWYVGIKGKNLKWFHSYLTNREQFIKYRSQNTNLEVLRCGVPQDSIIGPLIFLIFLNDLKKSTKWLKSIVFFDTTNLFHTNKNVKVLFKTVNKELHYGNELFLADKISFKAGKNKYLFFHKQRARDSIPLRLPTLTFKSIKIIRQSFAKLFAVIKD